MPRMLWRISRRRTSIIQLMLIGFLGWTVLEVLLIRRGLFSAAQKHRERAVLREPVRVFIASIHWNNEYILRHSWNKGIIDLARVFGPENIFASVYESGSWDASKTALRELDNSLRDLGVPRKILVDPKTHKDEISAPPVEPQPGWIRTPRNRIELRRIPYLARLRNKSLEPLVDLAKNGTVFDYVLFLNDVVFTVQDILTLLNTNNGDYAAACSLDFSNPPGYYDTFALRDAEGHEHAAQTWPYLRSSRSRSAIKRGEAAPVSSCWNGMVFMPAASFTGPNALSFRGIDDSLAESHLEASECCLIHADNPASKQRGVFLNPNVRVAYNERAYGQVHPSGLWPGITEIWIGLWKNIFNRWITILPIKEWMVRRLQRDWEKRNPGREENGGFCLINEMQVLVENGWAHV